MAACVALMVLAVLSHETAVVVPVVCAALLVGMSPKRPSIKQLAPLAIPIVLVLAFRIAQSFGSLYVAPQMTSAEVVSRIKYFVLGPFFPTGLVTADAVGRFTTTPEAVAFWLGLLVNAVAVALLIWFARHRPVPRAVALFVAVLVACVPGVLMSGQSRFMGLSVVVATVVIAYLASVTPSLRTLYVGVLLVSQAAWFVAGVGVGGEFQTAMVRQAGQFYDTSQTAIQRNDPKTVVLVNDRTGFGGARAMLVLAAWPNTDVELVVLNSFTGPADPRAYVDIARDGSLLRFESVFGPRQLFYFWGANPVLSKPVSGFTFTDVVTNPDGFGGGFRVQGEKDPGSVLVLGVDPSNNRMLTPEMY